MHCQQFYIVFTVLFMETFSSKNGLFYWVLLGYFRFKSECVALNCQFEMHKNPAASIYACHGQVINLPETGSNALPLVGNLGDQDLPGDLDLPEDQGNPEDYENQNLQSTVVFFFFRDCFEGFSCVVSFFYPKG